MPFKKGHSVYPGAEKGWFKKGVIPWAKGKKFPERSGEKHPNWTGGKAHHREQLIKWRNENRQRINAYSREYKKNHYAKTLYNNARRRVREIKAIGTHTFGEWELLKKQHGHICVACRRSEPKIILTEDHIIPLSKGGTDYIENIQPLCRSCNSKKYTRIIKYVS